MKHRLNALEAKVAQEGILRNRFALVTDQGESNSRMKFRKRPSASFMSSRYERISFLLSWSTELLGSSLLAEAMVPCRPLASAIIADLLPAASRPKVTRKECSKVA